MKYLIILQNIPDELIMTAGKAVAYSVPDSYFKEGRIYPDIKDIRNVSALNNADLYLKFTFMHKSCKI